MSFDPVRYGFDFNNREIAALIYLALIFGALLLRKEGRPKQLAVIRAFFSPKLAQIWIAMTLYVVASVCLLAWLNLWAWSNLKSTLLWWVTVGFLSLFEALRLKERPELFRRLVLEAFTVTAVLVFVVELVSFPLWVELLMLPALAFLTIFAAVAEQRLEHAAVFKLLRGVQALAGLLIFVTSLVLISQDVDEFWFLNKLREFGLPFLLWLLFAPFIFLLAVIMAYEDSFLSLKLRPQSAPIVGYARWRALLAFGLDIGAVKRLSWMLHNLDIDDELGVGDAIREIKTVQQRQKNPPHVDRAEGWSPFEACLFLKEHGIVTSDYHRTPWEWRADAPSVKLSDTTFANSLSYIICGNERAATRLHISLDAWKEGDNRDAQLAFNVRALTLLSKVFGDGRAEDVFARARAASPEAVEVDSVLVSYSGQEWGENRIGGYCRALTLRHLRHIEND